MDRSFGSSTSLLHTPSPLDRRSSPLSSSTFLGTAQLAQSIPASSSTTTTVQPLSFNPQNVPVRTTTSAFGSAGKAVRFSPAQTNAAGYSSAPSSRIQGWATPPRSHGSPSLLKTAAANASGGSGFGYGKGAVATPPRQQDGGGSSASGQSQGQDQQRPAQLHFPNLAATPHKVQSALAHTSSLAVHAVQDRVHHAEAVAQDVKKKLETVPLGRGEAAHRLRVNAVLLVAWWVSSRTTLYRFAAGHLVAFAPGLDTPLHICETVLLLVLCYNIIDSLKTLNTLSSLPASTTVAPFSSPARPGPIRPSSSSASLSSPARSSPKTRPSPSVLESPSAANSPTTSRLRTNLSTPSSPFRSSALASPHPPTPQTPSSALKHSQNAAADEAASILRRSFGAHTPTQGEAGAVKDQVQGALVAYEARHSVQESPSAGRRVKVESREDVERLFE
ncbi:hypothetical protein NBRC10512_004888 [Rhodotorula toruloides]|uniref:RHTO0S01e12068g1_1 n=2 Tax=Rhodotorula toruloides TaxID=5286 RepID=A0A061AEM2_RHOTO|nr:uncharacterized protein RHTO_04723 [Rhodotorula toruloides NP11]EMS24544.1 hypothetical protein RHTO_04723 [Rhodotorula toruloides NP11]CDR36004.1 RHTO0S01e12068g1_1 [Rhodotorula toruloides]